MFVTTCPLYSFSVFLVNNFIFIFSNNAFISCAKCMTSNISYGSRSVELPVIEAEIPLQWCHYKQYSGDI